MVTTEYDEIEPVETMGLEGGEPCLDFVNTASGRAEGPLREKLHVYGDLGTFAERVGSGLHVHVSLLDRDVLPAGPDDRQIRPGDLVLIDLELVRYDEFAIDVEFRYRGRAPELPASGQ